MLKVEPASKTLCTRLVTLELRETLPRMKRGESVVVPVSRTTASYNARKEGVTVIIETIGVPEGHVRVVRA